MFINTLRKLIKCDQPWLTSNDGSDLDPSQILYNTSTLQKSVISAFFVDCSSNIPIELDFQVDLG